MTDINPKKVMKGRKVQDLESRKILAVYTHI